MDLTVSHLSTSFGDHPVLQDFSVRFPEGQITCIRGPSGCGKTTLFNLLLGHIVPDAGEIAGMPERVSVVFQEDRLCEDFSALSNLRFALGRKVPAEQLTAALSELGLDGGDRRPVRTWSGGMKRRVALARAVLFESDLLLLDEPFKGLDEESRRQAAEFLLRRRAGRTVLCITHDDVDARLLGAQELHMA